VEAGTDAHYVDAPYYDHAYRRRRQDVRFYADLAERLGGPVLELGVGTGRVAIAIARRGVEVVGVDRVPEMLAQARMHLGREPSRVRNLVTLKKGDLTRLRLERRFPLVIAPFNVFMHLYERQDWERALATVKAHLKRRGRLAFDIRLPDLVELARDPQKTYRGRPVTRPDDGLRYRYGEGFEYDPVTQIELVTMVFEREGAPESFFITPLAHRQVFPAELEALLHYNGFTIVERFGDFDRSELGAESESQIVIARARGN
jgi:SAM-dependent methyltransferase